ncbi:MAG TPA: hypothetical protein VNF47_27065 [Streptosporangiaceae bacterium]|nr:hypothetical protein [Streptosporangiaceae bacterium]
MTTTRLVKAAAVTTGTGAAITSGYVGRAWSRYGRVDTGRYPRDRLLDRFLPDPEVDEYQECLVHAPAPVTLAVAKRLDLQAAPLVKGIFWLRSVPGLQHGQPPRRTAAHGLLAESLALGWGVLAEDPGHEIVVGAYTQPWRRDVVFRSLPPGEFAAFAEPGYVKIVWTLAALPSGPGQSVLVTRTRAVATDPQARRRFRRYWAPMSAGIALIRYLSFPLVKQEARRRSFSVVRPTVRSLSG